VAGQVLRTVRAEAIDADAGPWSAAFRATAYPSLKLGDRWYVYSAVQLNSEPYFFYESYYPDREVEARVLQAFLGYAWTGERKALGAKIGKLSSAFGSFPLRYDETDNPLLDQPLGYSAYLHIRPDALPCGVRDLPNLRSYTEYSGVRFYCGGQMTLAPGLLPVTLYGLPGIEMDASFHGWDARFQLTNSSPANPQSLFSESQHAQWTAGAGWTLWQGLRIGVSAMRGPFLDQTAQELLPAGTTSRDYSASAVGADIQWSRGRRTANAEWFGAKFPYPRLLTPATLHAVYGEVRTTVTPRLYAAVRASWQIHNRVEDRNRRSPLSFQPNVQGYELVLGFRVNRLQLLKAGYEWLHTDGVSGSQNNVFGLQFVTSIHSLSRAIR
jgi:hypothetical protein